MDFFVMLRNDFARYPVECECQICQRTISVSLTAFAFIYFRCERRQDSEVGFHRLEVFEVGVCDVVTKRAEHGGLGKGDGLFMLMEACSVDARQQTSGDVAYVALHASDLTCKEKVSALFMLKCGK